MLKAWIRWLPLVLVERIARSKCERITVMKPGGWWCMPFKDVLIKVDKDR